MKKVLIVACLIAGTNAASAQDYNVGAGVSTLGFTLEGSVKVAPRFRVRGILAQTPSVSGEYEIDDYTVDGDLRVGGIALMGDFYPWETGWRVSAGLLYSNTRLNGQFTGPQNFDGWGEFDNEIAPVIAGGYQHQFRNGMTLSGEIGAIISGFSVGTNSTNPAVLSEVASINDELSGLPVYPYAAIMLGFSF